MNSRPPFRPCRDVGQGVSDRGRARGAAARLPGARLRPARRRRHGRPRCLALLLPETRPREANRRLIGLLDFTPVRRPLVHGGAGSFCALLPSTRFKHQIQWWKSFAWQLLDGCTMQCLTRCFSCSTLIDFCCSLMTLSTFRAHVGNEANEKSTSES